MEVEVADPWVDPKEAQREYGLSVMSAIRAEGNYDAVIAAVAHCEFAQLLPEQWRQIVTPTGIILDLKGTVPRSIQALRL